MRRLPLALSPLLLPAPARACAVCFGLQDGAGLPRAYTWGILLMLGATFLMLGGLAYVAWRIELRRSGGPGAGRAPLARSLATYRSRGRGA